MRIGRQSLYDTFGDKWKLYCSRGTLIRSETSAHIALLPRQTACTGRYPVGDGTRCLDNANEACLGVNSICEFGQRRPDLAALHHAADLRLKNAAIERIREAQAAGDLAGSLPAEAVPISSLPISPVCRIAARGGAGRNICSPSAGWRFAQSRSRQKPCSFLE